MCDWISDEKSHTKLAELHAVGDKVNSILYPKITIVCLLSFVMKTREKRNEMEWNTIGNVNLNST